jgi:hypothetical protein
VTEVSSARFDDHIKSKIKQVAAITGMTPSEVRRKALTEYCDRELRQSGTSRYDDIIGVGESSGAGDLSRRRKVYFHELMNDKYGSDAPE